jgi:hypothetical protein
MAFSFVRVDSRAIVPYFSESAAADVPASCSVQAWLLVFMPSRPGMQLPAMQQGHVLPRWLASAEELWPGKGQG